MSTYENPAPFRGSLLDLLGQSAFLDTKCKAQIATTTLTLLSLQALNCFLLISQKKSFSGFSSSLFFHWDKYPQVLKNLKDGVLGFSLEKNVQRGKGFDRPRMLLLFLTGLCHTPHLVFFYFFKIFSLFSDFSFLPAQNIPEKWFLLYLQILEFW